ncbi:hypothetical protein BJX62DRAFT_248362 [Aspergillus germanicus]
MAFPAYEMLRAQNQLLESSAVSEASDRLPRVWLVSFKAQIWRLYVATMEQDENEEYDYNIYNVGGGDVSGKWDALKLVLLLDCIFDWALIIYRLDIFESLQSMVAPNARASISNVAPTVSDLSEALDGLGISDPIGSRVENLNTIQEDTPEDVLKYKHGWIRDGRQVLTPGEGLLITETNIADIFHNFEHPDHAKRFARMIWALLRKDAWLFPSEAILDKVREVWTGGKEHRQQVPDVPIHVKLEVYVYFDTQWQLTRKLIFVAVSKDSILELFRRTQYDKRRLSEIDIARRTVLEKKFLAELRECRKPSLPHMRSEAHFNIEEAVRRWHCSLVPPRASNPGDLPWSRVSVPSCDKAFQEIFRMYQVGQREPSESFLKIWHSAQPTIFDVTLDQDWLVSTPTVSIRLRGLGEFGHTELGEFFSYYQEEGFKELDYHHTVLRGKYLSGSTHFDDNRPESEFCWFMGPKFELAD